MPKIQQLSPHVADLIAAGEVVDRPAGAAKELIENAIDAGAKNITVELQGGGMTFLRVTDDGCGMSAEDAPTAFLRHATSKLRQASDLEAIHTLGFRGEALAAISAVSRVELLTKTADADFGTSLQLEAGVVTEQGEAGCPNGTTIIVRDLFYNTPARMKFMKRDTVEAAAIVSMAQRLALAHPEVAFRVLRDGEEQLRTPGDGRLYSAVYAVFGRTSAQEMIEVDSHYEKYALTGYISKPGASRGNRSGQIFFVNGRHVRSKAMTVALEETYRNAIMVGRFPTCVLHLHLPEQLVDVNVHPAKTEVRFLREQDVVDCIRYGAQGALERASGRVPLRLPNTQEKKTQAVPKKDFFRQMSAEDYRAAAAVLRDGAAEATRAMRADERAYAKPEVPAPARPVVAPYGGTATEDRRVRRPGVPCREATDGADEQVGTMSEVPAPAYGCPRPTERLRKTDVGMGHAPDLLNQRLCQRGQSPLANRLDSATPFCSLHPPQAALANVPDREAADRKDEQIHTNSEVPAPAGTCPRPTERETEPEQQEIALPAQEYRIVGEVLDTYIIVEQDRQVLLIDKHAAHERILFERLRQSAEPVMSQMLLEPILCKPEREEAAILLENAPLLSECGFELSDYGDGTLAVRRLPSELAPDDAASVLSQLAADLRAGKRTDPAALRDKLLHTLACKAAIKGGRHTDEREREVLVKRVLGDPSLKYCPHGRPIVAVLTASQLERSFGRA